MKRNLARAERPGHPDSTDVFPILSVVPDFDSAQCELDATTIPIPCFPRVVAVEMAVLARPAAAQTDRSESDPPPRDLPVGETGPRHRVDGPATGLPVPPPGTASSGPQSQEAQPQEARSHEKPSTDAGPDTPPDASSTAAISDTNRASPRRPMRAERLQAMPTDPRLLWQAVASQLHEVSRTRFVALAVIVVSLLWVCSVILVPSSSPEAPHLAADDARPVDRPDGGSDVGIEPLSHIPLRAGQTAATPRGAARPTVAHAQPPISSAPTGANALLSAQTGPTEQSADEEDLFGSVAELAASRRRADQPNPAERPATHLADRRATPRSGRSPTSETREAGGARTDVAGNIATAPTAVVQAIPPWPSATRGVREPRGANQPHYERTDPSTYTDPMYDIPNVARRPRPTTQRR